MKCGLAVVAPSGEVEEAEGDGESEYEWACEFHRSTSILRLILNNVPDGEIVGCHSKISRSEAVDFSHKYFVSVALARRG